MDPRVRAVVAAVADLALVAVFVLIGRASHGEAEGGFLVTSWPFAAGLAVGWASGLAWRRPFAPLRAGVPAWLGTVAIGMVLRAVAGQGVQVAFVVVAAIVTGVLLLGWRLVLRLTGRRAASGAARSAPSSAVGSPAGGGGVRRGRG